MALFGGNKPWGADAGCLWNYPGVADTATKSNDTHSQMPMNAGSSVVAVKWTGGVVIAADILASNNGSMARFKNCPRIVELGKHTALAASGDYADFQYMRNIVQRNMIAEQCLDDGVQMKPRSLHCWLTRVLYNRRNKMDPFWNTFVVAGMQDGEPFLGAVDMRGMAYENDCIGTGFATHFALPLLREKAEGGPIKDEATAIQVVKQSMENLFYRDCRAYYKYQLATITESGVKILENQNVKQEWDIALTIDEY